MTTTSAKKMPFDQYHQTVPVDLEDRTWPSRQLTNAPTWCSVDLRDGNQALIDPMDPERKLALFETLVAMGFKEIEVGLPVGLPDRLRLRAPAHRGGPDPRRRDDPGAGPVPRGADRADLRVAARRPAGDRPLLQLDLDAPAPGGLRPGPRRASSRSRPTRRAGARSSRRRSRDRDPLRVLARELHGDRARLRRRDLRGGHGRHRADPGAPADLQPARHRRDVHAQPLRRRHRVVRPTIQTATRRALSVHPHNDRGTAVAAAELASWPAPTASRARCSATASAPATSTSSPWRSTCSPRASTPSSTSHDIDKVRRVAEYATRMPVHPRHPYAGDLVYTAFSGSHQDAIKKGMAAIGDAYESWEVPYLPIDPNHTGRTYEAIIRVNSQSGKGGVAYLMDTEHGLDLPRRLQVEFSKQVQALTEATRHRVIARRALGRVRDDLPQPDDRRRCSCSPARCDGRRGHVGRRPVARRRRAPDDRGRGQRPDRRVRRRALRARWASTFEVPTTPSTP